MASVCMSEIGDRPILATQAPVALYKVGALQHSHARRQTAKLRYMQVDDVHSIVPGSFADRASRRD